MSNDDEFRRVAEIERAANDMDEAFCARMRMAIDAGLENAPIGVITRPGTQSPKYVPTEHLWPQVSPLVDMDF
jgi:hypothetical protein